MTHFTRYLLTFSCVALFAGCGGGGGGAGGGNQGLSPANALVPSVLCADLRGGEGLAWEVYNGVVRTDPVLSPLPPAGPVYFHPSQPRLGFFRPPNYTAFDTDLGVHEFGVDLVRNDNQVVWREYRRNVFGNVSSVAVRDAEVQGVLNHLGLQGGVQVLCAREAAVPDPFTGSVLSGANIMFRAGNHTAIVLVTSVFTPSLGSTSTLRKVMLAPTAEFGARAIDTFLAIDWQMNLGDDSGFKDTDGDGWRDSADIEPRNPNQPTPGGLPR